MKKLSYKEPKIVVFSDDIAAGVPGALYGAALMVARAVAKAMKGGIDLEAGINTPHILQKRKKEIEKLQNKC